MYNRNQFMEDFMESFSKIDDRLFDLIFNHKYDLLLEVWEEIRNNKELLEWAIIPTKNPCGDRDIVNGIAISDLILRDSENVDKDIYQKLVNTIYTIKHIARLGAYEQYAGSYLMLTIMNPKLKLTEKQKSFAVSEAMEMRGTVKYENRMDDFAKSLDQKGITDEQTIYTSEFGPVPAKAICIYISSILSLPDGLENHASSGDFDIRYWILKNPNWSLDEKKKLVMDFWADSDEYDRTLDGWEWAIVNDEANRKGYTMPIFFDDKDDIYNYTYEELLEFYDNKKTTDEIWNEIQFCAFMHEIRPQQMEVETDPDKLEELEYRIYG